jgi:prohibitin 2
MKNIGNAILKKERIQMSYRKSEEGSEWLKGGCVVLVVVLVLSFGVMWISSMHRVDPGYAGVVVNYNMNSSQTNVPLIQDMPMGQYVVVWPWEFKRIVMYPTSQQTLSMVRRAQEGKVTGDDSVECTDQSGIRINVDSTTQWRVAPNSDVGKLYIMRPNVPLVDSSDQDIESLVVRREVRSSIGMACSLFSYVDIYGEQRQKFTVMISAKLAPTLQGNFLTLDSFLLGEIYLQAAQTEAIAKVAAAQQQVKETAYLAESARNRAAATVAEAKGQADAIALIQAQIAQNPTYVAYMYAKQWNGIMPQTYVAGTGASLPLLAIPTSNSVEAPIAPTMPITK